MAFLLKSNLVVDRVLLLWIVRFRLGGSFSHKLVRRSAVLYISKSWYLNCRKTACFNFLKCLFSLLQHFKTTRLDFDGVKLHGIDLMAAWLSEYKSAWKTMLWSGSRMFKLSEIEGGGSHIQSGHRIFRHQIIAFWLTTFKLFFSFRWS